MVANMCIFDQAKKKSVIASLSEGKVFCQPSKYGQSRLVRCTQRRKVRTARVSIYRTHKATLRTVPDLSIQYIGTSPICQNIGEPNKRR